MTRTPEMTLSLAALVLILAITLIADGLGVI